VFGLFALKSRPSLAPWDAQLRIVGGMSSHTIGADHDSDEVVALKQALSNKGTPCFMVNGYVRDTHAGGRQPMRNYTEPTYQEATGAG
jgi:hypothetical protein